MKRKRKRVKGWRMPENSKYVDRPTAGNPFKLTPDGFIMCYSINRRILDKWVCWSETGGYCQTDINELYERWLKGELRKYSYLPVPPDIN